MAGKRAAPKRHFIEFSKLAVTATFLLVVGFILYVCVEMHIQQNLHDCLFTLVFVKFLRYNRPYSLFGGNRRHEAVDCRIHAAKSEKPRSLLLM